MNNKQIQEALEYADTFHVYSKQDDYINALAAAYRKKCEELDLTEKQRSGYEDIIVEKIDDIEKLEEELAAVKAQLNEQKRIIHKTYVHYAWRARRRLKNFGQDALTIQFEIDAQIYKNILMQFEELTND